MSEGPRRGLARMTGAVDVAVPGKGVVPCAAVLARLTPVEGKVPVRGERPGKGDSGR